MSETRKANVPEATYFVTLTVDSWVDVFTRMELVDELLNNIRYPYPRSGGPQTAPGARLLDNHTDLPSARFSSASGGLCQYGREGCK